MNMLMRFKFIHYRKYFDKSPKKRVFKTVQCIKYMQILTVKNAHCIAETLSFLFTITAASS